MILDQYKNIMIALFICAAIGVITFILLFIHPSVGDEQKKLLVRFTDIDKVSPGTRVTYGGKPVGEVVAVREIPGERDHRETRNGRVYLYELELDVDSSVRLFNSDEISLRTSGLLGEKSIAITPLPPQPGQKLRSVDREVIYAVDTGSVEQTFKEFKEIADKFEQTLDSANRILEQLERDRTFKNIARTANYIADITEALHKPRELSEIVDNIHSLSNDAAASWKRVDRIIDTVGVAADHVRDITTALDQPENLSQIVENVHTLSVRAISSWDTVDIALEDIAATAANAHEITNSVNQPEQLKQIVFNAQELTDAMRTTWPAIDGTIHSLSQAATDAAAILHHIQSGEGSLGHLVMRDELYLRTASLFNKAEVILNDINHFGIFFSLDKSWQRLRARRLNLLMKLRTAQEFRNYFNDELDKVTTSLARVEMVVEKNSSLCPMSLLLDDKDFSRVYAELLRRVEGLQEALKMYNQQAIDVQLERTEFHGGL